MFGVVVVVAGGAVGACVVLVCRVVACEFVAESAEDTAYQAEKAAAQIRL